MPQSVEASQGKPRKKRAGGSRKRRVSNLLRQIEAKLSVDDMKITLGDFIRLMQLERDLDEDEQPREIIITWKDPSERPAG